MKKHYQIILLLLLIFSFLCSKITAQITGNYPVSINPVIYPPYPTAIKFLNASTTPSLVLTITNKSATNLSIDCYLNITITAKNFTAKSRSINVMAPITVTSGMPLRLTNVDIAQLFDFSNLTGVSLNQYESAFPAAKTTFTFVLYDAATSRQVSDNVNYTVVYSINQPPNLILPADATTQTEKTIQNIIFQWQPRQATAPNAVQYKFELVELFDNTQNPLLAFLTNPIFFTDSTFSNTYIYGPDKPALLTGKTYAWRVKAASYDNGGFQVSNFENNGYSTIFSFKYFAECKAPTMLQVKDIDKTSATVQWDALPEYANFIFHHRKKGDGNWKETTLSGVTENIFYLTNLIGVTTYEVKVSSLCSGTSKTESTIKEFKTTNVEQPNKVVKVNATCGKKPDLPKLSTDLLASLKANDIIKVADYSIVVDNGVTGQNGIFKGTGVAEIWIGKTVKIPVSFNQIKINKKYEVTDGVIIPILQ
ncbi:MAG: fibronectin type III domain-containing protein [Chitinophagaceae bacterium]|nr:fibronectin type III domain-containing protein [Chitinophagaceae bacterium]